MANQIIIIVNLANQTRRNVPTGRPVLLFSLSAPMKTFSRRLSPLGG